MCRLFGIFLVLLIWWQQYTLVLLVQMCDYYQQEDIILPWPLCHGFLFLLLGFPFCWQYMWLLFGCWEKMSWIKRSIFHLFLVNWMIFGYHYLCCCGNVDITSIIVWVIPYTHHQIPYSISCTDRNSLRPG